MSVWERLTGSGNQMIPLAEKGLVQMPLFVVAVSQEADRWLWPRAKCRVEIRYMDESEWVRREGRGRECVALTRSERKTAIFQLTLFIINVQSATKLGKLTLIFLNKFRKCNVEHMLRRYFAYLQPGGISCTLPFSNIFMKLISHLVDQMLTHKIQVVCFPVETCLLLEVSNMF